MATSSWPAAISGFVAAMASDYLDVGEPIPVGIVVGAVVGLAVFIYKYIESNID